MAQIWQNEKWVLFITYKYERFIGEYIFVSLLEKNVNAIGMSSAKF
jgi:hypothetical protein